MRYLCLVFLSVFAAVLVCSKSEDLPEDGASIKRQSSSSSIQCWAGSEIKGGERSLSAMNCSSQFDQCLKCYIPKDHPLNRQNATVYSYACTNQAQTDLYEALGAEGCFSCSTSLCNLATHLFPSTTLALALLLGLVVSAIAEHLRSH